MENQNTNTTASAAVTTPPVANKPAEEPKVSRVAQADFVKQIIEKLRKSENILVALSNNPNIDEIAAAIAMAIYLDSQQKHVTAIYSGRFLVR